jgi:uncharacterized membrane protein YeaQ/YmgE (transglycosylase-associated protein family)
MDETPHIEEWTVIWSIISAIIVGTIIGALGRLVLPGRQNIAIWLTIVIGIAAALLGTVIANVLGVGDTGGFDWIEFIIQVALAAGGVALASGYLKGRTA